MAFLIVRTDVRAIGPDQLASSWVDGVTLRDERTAPEARRQTVCAEDREAALRLARALAAVGAVRSGRQRVKVVRLGAPETRTVEPDLAAVQVDMTIDNRAPQTAGRTA
jgi:hypothetical protein